MHRRGVRGCPDLGSREVEARSTHRPAPRAAVLAALLVVAVAGGARGQGGAKPAPDGLSPAAPPAAPPGGALRASPSPERRPRLRLEPAVLSFGEIDQGAVAQLRFRIQNDGTAPLKVVRIRPSCGCTVVAAPTAPVPPGQSTVVEVTYHSRGKRGRQGSTLLIETNDPTRPRAIVSVRGLVRVPPRPRLELRPVRVDLGLLRPGEERRQVVSVRNVGEKDLVLGAPRPGPAVSVASSPKSRTIPPGARLELEVVLKVARNASGLWNGWLSVPSNDPVQPRATLLFFGYVAKGRGAPQLAVVPGSWDAGVVTQDAARLIDLVNVGGAPLTVRAARARPPIEARAVDRPLPTELAPGARLGLELRVRRTPGPWLGHTLDGYVEIDSSDPRAPRRLIRVVGFLPMEADAATSATPAGVPAAAPATLAFSADRGGEIEPCRCAAGRLGGLARLATALRPKPGHRPTPLLLAGDLLGPPAPHQRLRVGLIFDALQRVGGATVAVGEADLAHGVSTLSAAAARAGVTLLATNLRSTQGKPIFSSERKLRVGGEVFGVLSALGPDLLPPSTAAALGVKLTDPDVAVRAGVASLQRGGATRLVLLAHTGRAAARALAQRHPELDLVIVGHGGAARETAEVVGRRTALVECSDGGKHLGRVTFGTRGAPPSVRRQALTKDIRDDPVVASRLRAYRLALRSLPLPPRPARSPYVGSAACERCHPKAFQVWMRSRHRRALGDLRPTGHDVEPGCVRCHATGVGAAGGFVRADRTPALAGVGCEACHGPGAAHAKAPKSGYGPVIVPARCLTCHDPDNSPAFDPKTYPPRIRHW